MADQVDSMSDAELRTRLAEHGFPVMPITASTRKLLVKKLKLVLDNKAKPRNGADKAETRRSLAKYSSGEDSDMEPNNKEKRGRRTTAMLPPANRTRRPTPKKESPVKPSVDVGSESEEEKSPIRTQEEVETVTTRRVTRTYANENDYETGSDSDVDTKKVSAPARSSSRSSDYISSTLPTHDASTSPPKSSMYSRPSSSSVYSPMSSSDHLNSIRSRLGLSSSFTDRPSVSNYNQNYSTNYASQSSGTDEVESPYLSNFTRRLSTLKTDIHKPSYLDRDITNGSTYPRRSYISSIPRTEIVDNSSDKRFYKNNLVSLTLVAIVALFFFCLFFMYIVKKNDLSSVLDDQNNVIPICKTGIPSNRPGINCVSEDRVSCAKDLLKAIHPELSKRTASYACGEDVLPYLTENEVIKIANSKETDLNINNRLRIDLHNLQILIANNIHWGLSIVALKNLYSKDINFIPISTVTDIARQRTSHPEEIAIAITNPSTPISCLIRNTLYSAGSTLILGLITAAVIIGALKLWKVYMSYRKQKSEEIYSMVEQIIDVISQETEDSGEPYISIDHVRDTLISPQNREKMNHIWEAALKFIQKNESRVRMEIQSVDGDDCRVWRWISHGSPKRSAAWQGQAFETQEGSVNNLPVSPTPCLKIRHMFDKNDTNPNLRGVIQDAILEKCGEHCNILHLDIERTSCCVYVKCASPTDAGVVYRSLHGWWYEGRLITVKYLRLERYMQRFPASPSLGPYLKSRQRRGRDE